MNGGPELKPPRNAHDARDLRRYQMGKKIEFDEDEMFTLLSEFFENVSSDAVELFRTKDGGEVFTDRLKASTDRLHHEILVKSKREKKEVKEEEKKGRMELDWS